ncbi:MAG: DUF3829 domain-containing protein [Nannocystaceae bacterium]|nr:DUF3829 domain-containing protein [Nannocystaceae bacterium]
MRLHPRYRDVTVDAVLFSRWLALLLAVASGSCDEFGAAARDAMDDSDVAPVPEPPQTDVSTAAPLSDATLAAQKLSRYAECFYRTRPQCTASEVKWRASVGTNGKPVKRRLAPEIGLVSDERGICDAIDREGATLHPAMAELEGATASYVDALRQVAPYTRELREYYEGEGFNEDGWATSTRIAPTLSAAFARLTTAAEAMFVVLDHAQAASEQALLDDAQDADHDSLARHVYASMLAARSWVRCVVPTAKETDTEHKPSSKSADAVSVVLESCDVAMSGLITTQQALGTRRSSQPQAAARVFWLTAFAHSLRQLRQLAERLHAPPPTKTGSSRRSGKRSKEKRPPPPSRSDITRAFGALVLDFGQLNFAASAPRATD